MAHQHDMSCLEEVGGKLVCKREPAGLSREPASGSDGPWKVKGGNWEDETLWTADSRPEYETKVRGRSYWPVRGRTGSMLPPSSPHVGGVHAGFLSSEQPDPGGIYFFTRRATHVYLTPGYGDRGREVFDMVRRALLDWAHSLGLADPKKIHGRETRYEVFELPRPVTPKEGQSIVEHVRRAVDLLVTGEESRIKKAVAEQDMKAAEHRKRIAGLLAGDPISVFFPISIGLGGASVTGTMKLAGPATSQVTCIPPGRKRRGTFAVPNQHIGLR